MKNEKGFILVLALLMMLVMTAIGLASMNSSIMEIKLAGNDLLAKKAFMKAEGGTEEWHGMLNSDKIKDELPDSADWRYFLAKDLSRAKEIGYDSSNPVHKFITSETPFSEWDVAVVGRHKLGTDGKVFRVSNQLVYYVTSHGWEQQTHKITEIELARNPGIGPPAAVYSERPVVVNGASTRVDGNDSCGGENKPGILTSGDLSTITVKNGLITGNPATSEKQSDAFAIKDAVSSLKDLANLRYGQYTSNTNIQGVDVAGKWGIPVITDANTPMPIPTASPVIVYIDANVVNTVELTGQVNGAGILMVDGDLDIAGGFNWFGLVIATGAVKVSGNGNRNITGGVITGEVADLGNDATFTGGIGIFYCSKMTDWLKDKVKPTRKLAWKEIF